MVVTTRPYLLSITSKKPLHNPYPLPSQMAVPMSILPLLLDEGSPEAVGALVLISVDGEGLHPDSIEGEYYPEEDTAAVEVEVHLRLRSLHKSVNG